MEQAQHNTLAFFANRKPEFTLLTAVDDAFGKITENLLNINPLMPAFFLFRSRASYLGAVRLALSGQVPETYMVLRGCLENSLYGLHIFRVPDAYEIWLKRHNDEKSLKQCGSEFQYANVLKSLKAENMGLGEIVGRLYKATIDYGGHPNEASLTSIIRKREDKSNITFIIPYLIDYRINPDAFDLGLKRSVEIGVSSLLIFKLIYRERFDLLGISDNLEKLRKVLISKRFSRKSIIYPASKHI
jgi:hypothetical protein